MEDYYEILKVFNLNRIDYLVIGTWALKKAFPEKMSHYKIKDCDLQIKFEMQQIHRLIRLLKDYNWKVCVWENEIDDQVEEAFLKNKYYIRATQDQLTLDITYENEYLTWEEMFLNKHTIDDFTLGSLEHILHLKEIKGTPNDLKIIQLFKNSKTN